MTRTPLLALIFLAGAAQLSGCAGPGYYAQAIGGHLRLMHGRRDIDSILADPSADPELVARLRRVDEIRTFAAERLGLTADGAYSWYVATGREAVTWNVVAAPEFSLEPKRWCFPVAGCVPYRGYFERESAERFAERLKRKGYDVAVSPAGAYSTLGWFDDPLTDIMLQRDNEQLAGFLFHELAHQKLYVKGDTAFNESYASFVEEKGVLLWLEARGDRERLSRWLEYRQAARELGSLLEHTRRELAAIYRSAQPREEMRAAKAAALSAFETAYRALVLSSWSGRDWFASWFSGGLNNASLALLQSYRGGVCAFAELYREAGGDMNRFHALAAQKAALPAGQRADWLGRPCKAVASGGEL